MSSSDTASDDEDPEEKSMRKEFQGVMGQISRSDPAKGNEAYRKRRYKEVNSFTNVFHASFRLFLVKLLPKQ